MRKVVAALLIWIFYILQSTVLAGIPFFKIIPNLMIILVASFGFMRGDREGMVIGFFSGLFCDLFYGEMIGFYALLYMYIGFLNGKFSGIFFPEDPKLPIALIAVSDFSYGMIVYCVNFLLQGNVNVGSYMIQIIIPEMICTVMASVVFYPLVLIINERLEDRERRRAKKFV